MRIDHDFNEERLVLPAYQAVIFDEAQHLEAVAAVPWSHLDEQEIERFCNRLLHKDGGGERVVGLLTPTPGERCLTFRSCKNVPTS